jgi:hypothetical protein
MSMKIYNHLRHYTQTTKNTKYRSLLSLQATFPFLSLRGTTVPQQSFSTLSLREA